MPVPALVLDPDAPTDAPAPRRTQRRLEDVSTPAERAPHDHTAPPPAPVPASEEVAPAPSEPDDDSQRASEARDATAAEPVDSGEGIGPPPDRLNDLEREFWQQQADHPQLTRRDRPLLEAYCRAAAAVTGGTLEVGSSGWSRAIGIMSRLARQLRMGLGLGSRAPGDVAPPGTPPGTTQDSPTGGSLLFGSRPRT